jgi:ATP-dependent DNA ligase
VQQHDLEGIVAKRKDGAYTPSAKWIKIKNATYSQAQGRGELFNPPKTARR